MLDFFRSRKEKALRHKVQEAIKGNNREELCMLLSENKACKLIRKTDGIFLHGCLLNAVGANRSECIEELLKAGVKPCYEQRRNTLMHAIFTEQVSILRLLLEYGANPDAGLRLKQPLYYAANFADLTCFRMLLLYGADPDYNCSHRDFLNSYPDFPSLLGMCLANNYEVQFVELLIQFGANMYLPDIQKTRIQVDNDAAKLLDREMVHPRSLMSQCRIAIRRSMKQVGKLGLIDQLEIPKRLLRYLQYHDELDNTEKLPRYYAERNKNPW
ncbi:ankyrin repeat and SOCS box protein 12-like isoform X2 [Bufo gargarizans]|uniref:ankyrin repeat and SOCS box protein 12-like isoform X2 n=1 Tax=Bufo gargarizans TaxID=30331 RepID=UPI001CF241CC|nr:ankyrin repeat and SOCS box protein 12-like isoform X2 [Bufo gargarizans]